MRQNLTNLYSTASFSTNHWMKWKETEERPDGSGFLLGLMSTTVLKGLGALCTTQNTNVHRFTLIKHRLKSGGRKLPLKPMINCWGAVVFNNREKHFHDSNVRLSEMTIMLACTTDVCESPEYTFMWFSLFSQKLDD